MEMWITAIATATIAFWGGCSLLLAWRIKSKEDEYKQNINDLFQAIVISNILSGEGGKGSTLLNGKIEYEAAQGEWNSKQ